MKLAERMYFDGAIHTDVDDAATQSDWSYSDKSPFAVARKDISGWMPV